MSVTHPGPETQAVVSSDWSRPIAEYGLLADCNSAALVDRDGSIGWLCLPRYDSPAVFAQILDPEGGHWQIRPSGAYRSERRYLPGTLVFRTTESGGRTFGGPNQVVVSAGVPTAIRDSTMSATFTVSAGDRLGFALQWSPPEGPAPEPFTPDQ